jgi:dihydroorotase
MVDLLIKNGKTVNNKKIEIAVDSGKIVKIGENLDVTSDQILDLKNGHYVSPGWIDAHVHAYEKMDLYYDYPDKIGVESGVTTVIDAGTTGAENIRDFYEISRDAKTNVYALINISKFGIVEQDELADLSKVEYERVAEKVKELPDFIVGLKARMSNSVIGKNGIKPLKMAKEFQKKLDNLPLMVHVGSAPPELDEIFEVLGKGDIVTHCFNGKDNGILDRANEEIKPFAREGQAKGIIYDVGHGSASFDFDVAETAFKEGITADSISTDIYSRNREDGPVYNMATTLEKMKVVGYTWPQIIDKITKVPADLFSLTEKGALEVGKDADITVFDIEKDKKELIDSTGNTRQTTEVIRPFKTIIGGVIYDNNL